MKAIVFGGGGFLGRALAPRLEAAGWSVQLVPRSLADIARAETLAPLDFTGDVVVNLAARVPTGPNTLDDAARMFAVNAVGAANVAEWAMARHVPRVVHGSTLVVATRPWPDPLTEAAPTAPTGRVAAYAASKLAGELVAGSIVREARASFLALRFSALYGPGMTWSGVLPTFIDTARAGEPLTATAGAHADFLHVDDAALAIVAACSAAHVTGVVNVAAGVETSIVELARLVSSAVTVAEGAVSRARVDVTRLRSELGVPPGVSIRDGVRALVGSTLCARGEKAS